jgi:hypothetical protein
MPSTRLHTARVVKGYVMTPFNCDHDSRARRTEAGGHIALLRRSTLDTGPQ